MSLLSQQDHYQVLGVTPSATEAEIMQVRERLLRDLFPDRNISQETKEEQLARFDQVSDNGIACQGPPSSLKS